MTERGHDKKKVHPENCGMNPKEPDQARPGCDAVYCEEIKNKQDCQTAKKHGHECRWGGDKACRTPPHLQKAPRASTNVDRRNDKDTWFAGFVRVSGRVV